MMQISRISDGAHELFDISGYDTLEALLHGVSEVLGIPVQGLVVFYGGRVLDEVVWEDVWERSAGGREGEGLFVFDREAFSSDPDEWVRGLEEDVILDIELPLRPLRSAHLPTQTLAPFLGNLGQIHRLEDRLRVQRIGLGIAGGNLGEHLGRVVERSEDGDVRGESEGSERLNEEEHQSSDRGWAAFQQLVERELERELGLIGPYHSSSSSIVPASTIHPSSTAHPPSTAHSAPSASTTQQLGWGIEQDMHVISSVQVHEIFMRSSQPPSKQDRGRKVSGVTGSPTGTGPMPPPTTQGLGSERQGLERVLSVQEKKKTLADYVNFGRMKVVRENCRKSYDDHQAQYSSISNDVFALQSATDQIAQSIQGLEMQLEHEVAEMVGHAEAVVEEARLLVLEDPDVHWQSLRALDATIRALVVSMTHLKNDFCLQLHIHLHSIAIQQSSIAQLTSSMSELETALLATRTGATTTTGDKTHTSGFTHLDRLRNMLSAYMTACVEIVWRKQLAELLEVKSSGLTEALAGYLEAERRRRRGFEGSEVAVLPPDINVFARQAGAATGDRGTPDFEFSVKAGYEETEVRPMTRGDIEALVATVESMKQDPSIAVCSTPNGVLDEAVTKARNLIEDMDLSLLQLETLWGDRPSMEIAPRGNAKLDRVTAEYEALQLSHARLQEQSHARRNSPELEAHLHALEHETATLQIELNHRQNAHEQDVGRMEQLEADRSQLLRGLSDARNDEATLEIKLHGLEAQRDAALVALEDVTAERDHLARENTDQVEAMVEARLGALRGDEDQVRLQNAALLDEMEKLKQDHQAKIDNLQNRQAREVDGLRAELGMAKAQLKESQKTKAELLQDLANTKSDLAGAKEETASASKFSLSSIKLASKYHDCVARLHTAIQSSATISGSTSALLKPQETATLEIDDRSVLQQELTSLDEYDLEAFTDAVNRTMSLVKKWQKSCRSYRDRAKDKIAFSNFGKGDLALFLPTRNATAKSWAAFNISSPHHFLNVNSHPSLEEQVKHREWIVARITKVDVDVVNTMVKPDSNPFGLAEGITYYSLSVEPFTPSGNRLRQSSTGSTMPAMTTPGALLTARTPPVKGSDYFGPISEAVQPATLRDTEPRTSLRRPSSVASSQGSTFSKKGKGIKYGNATKAASTLAVSSPVGGALDLEPRAQRRSFTSVDPGGETTGKPVPAGERPTMLHSQLRPGSFSRRLVGPAEADSGAGMGRGALDILKRFEAEREDGETKG